MMRVQELNEREGKGCCLGGEGQKLISANGIKWGWGSCQINESTNGRMFHKVQAYSALTDLNVLSERDCK